jgi:hypothetical protein
VSDRGLTEQFRSVINPNAVINPNGLPRRTPPTGVGEAAGGQISATVSAGGHLDLLHIDPDLLSSGTDAATVADGVRSAVNAAVDDLQARINAALEDPDGPVGSLDRAWQRISAEPVPGPRDSSAGNRDSSAGNRD